MRVLYKRPADVGFRQLNIDNDLRALQKLVGGYIETVTLATDACIICNEEGQLLGMPDNCWFCGIKYYGPILLVGVDGDEFTDAPMSLMVANGGIE